MDVVAFANSQPASNGILLNDPTIERLRTDSPSAALRIRAMRAFKSPAPAVFDVPHAEQSIITYEERNPPPAPSLSDMLKDIIVYVEVRTGDDNRSEGVKTIIKKMGAQVNDRLLRSTTHVIFKDGLLSTYKKAMQYNIPIVSILWIEACKMQRKLCDPTKFPISNQHLYEYPELYPKMPRIRCKQPDSELNKRIRKRPGTPSNEKENDAKGNSAKKVKLIHTPTSTRTPLRNGDITKFFRPVSLTKRVQELQEVASTIESPATKLLNQIDNGNFPIQSPLPSNNKENGKTAAKSLDFSANESAVTQKRGRRSTVEAAQISTPISKSRRRNSTHIGNSTINNATPEPRMTRRRSSLQNEGNSTPAPPITPQLAKKAFFESIVEEPMTENFAVIEKTNHLVQSLAISSCEQEAQKQQTLYTTERMELTEISKNNIDMDDNSKAGATILFTNVQIDDETVNSTDYEHTPGPVHSSTRLFGHSSNNRRRTLFSVPMDIVNERIKSINNASRRSLALQTTNTVSMESIEKEMPSQAVVKEISQPSEPQMRRLFTPNDEVVLSPPKSARKPRQSISSSSTSSSLSSSSSSTNKRRRTMAITPNMMSPLKDTSYGENKKLVSSEMTKIMQSKTSGRRSTLDFEPTSRKQEKLKTNFPAAIGDSTRTKNIGSDEHFVTPVNSDEFIKIGKSQLVNNPNGKKRVIRTMVHTNMHQEQIQVIHQAIRQLRGMRLEAAVSKRTTHLVSLEPRRTLNMMRGLMRGVWIVNYNWILESIRCGKWVPEEHYEMTIFSRAIEICRSERQALGSHYRCELFKHMEPFYVSSLCRPIQFNNMKELLLLGGAKLTENRFKAKYIIGDKRRAEDDRFYLSSYWVLDSITAMQVQKLSKYLMNSAIISPEGIKYESMDQMKVYNEPSNRDGDK